MVFAILSTKLLFHCSPGICYDLFALRIRNVKACSELKCNIHRKLFYFKRNLKQKYIYIYISVYILLSTRLLTSSEG